MYVSGLTTRGGAAPLPVTAVQCYALAVACDPTSAEAWFRCGLCLFNAARGGAVLNNANAGAADADANAADGGSSAATATATATASPKQREAFRRHCVAVNGSTFSIIDCFAQTVALAPDDPMGYNSLALALADAGAAAVIIPGVANPRMVASSSSSNGPTGGGQFRWTGDDLSAYAAGMLGVPAAEEQQQ